MAPATSTPASSSLRFRPRSAMMTAQQAAGAGDRRSGDRGSAAKTLGGSVAMRAAPSEIGGMRVVLWSVIDDRHHLTGGTRHVIAGQEMHAPSGLAICQDGPQSFFLFYCDEVWRSMTDTWHQDLDSARAQAEFEFANVSATWVG